MLKNAQKDFIQRHIGPSVDEQNVMLKELGYQSLDDLIKDTVPEKILLKDDLDIGDPNSEYKALRKLKNIAKKNVEVKVQEEMSKLTGGLQLPAGFKFPF